LALKFITEPVGWGMSQVAKVAQAAPLAQLAQLIQLPQVVVGPNVASMAQASANEPGLQLSWRGARWALAPQWSLDASMHRPSAVHDEAAVRHALQPGERRSAGLQLKLQHQF
jgi:hypothetical protein